MRRRLSEGIYSAWRNLKPALMPESISLGTKDPSIFCLGPSPVKWNTLFSERTTRIVHIFEQMCRRGMPIKREVQEVLWKLKTARLAAMEEVNQTRRDFERKSMALLNGIALSPSGSQILYWGAPAVLGSITPLLSQSLHRTNGPLIESKLVGINKRERSLVEELRLFWRFLGLAALFFPVMLTLPLALGLGICRDLWVRLVTWTLENAGPAFIKWGQWGATRLDLLPADLCRGLEKLHSHAPVHDFSHTRAEIEQSFGAKLEEIFTDFDTVPVASGSIAQVHKARLGPLAAAATGKLVGSWVAVKVRHPQVESLMQQDFTLMVRACSLISKMPFMKGLRLDESMRQFGAPLHEQLDLRVEATNLQRFRRNFKRWKSVRFPSPLLPLVSESVLVESFEDGDLISNLVHNPDYATSVQVSNMGVDIYLKMLTRDNFLHADLHPGNILVQESPSMWRRRPRLVLLDAGMVAELTPQDQKRVVHFFKALTRIDGADLAKSILEMAVEPSCDDKGAFVEDMRELFADLDFQIIKDRTSDVIQDILNTVRRHEVTLEGSVCSLVATTLVLEGWSTKLNPDISIMDTIRSTLPDSWAEKLSKTIDRLQLVTV